MNYKLSGRYKFYSTIINVCFVSIRESNNEEIMKKYDNYCIVVSADGSTIKSKDIFNARVDYFHHHVYMHNIRREGVRTRAVVRVTGERGGVEDRQTTILGPSGMGSSGSALFLCNSPP